MQIEEDDFELPEFLDTNDCTDDPAIMSLGCYRIGPDGRKIPLPDLHNKF